MATYLLAWNPKRWHWEGLAELVDRVQNGEAVEERWSCGRTRRIVVGDRVYLIRLGREPRGIIASGTVITGSYEAPHYDDDKAAAGQTCMHVDVQIESFLNPDPPQSDDVLPRALLDFPPFSDMHWDTQVSGVRIPDDIAQALDSEWNMLVSSQTFSFPSEVPETQTHIEGATRRISVNAYERSAAARRACIAHYGTSCSICGFDFGEVYGPQGNGDIHVHHIKPLSEIEGEYEVDPIQDLRPVCPNCHAMIHSKLPAYSIDEVKTWLSS